VRAQAKIEVEVAFDQGAKPPMTVWMSGAAGTVAEYFAAATVAVQFQADLIAPEAVDVVAFGAFEVCKKLPFNNTTK
jgi:hypothetical protein